MRSLCKIAHISRILISQSRLRFGPKAPCRGDTGKASASSTAASKAATFRSLRSPSIGSAYAIGWHTHWGEPFGPPVLHTRALLAASTMNLSNK